jgi:hypothetical protein
MITFVRTRSIAPGKAAEAMAFSQQVTKLIKDKFGVQLGASVPIGGNPDRIAFVSSYPGLAELESQATRLVADVDYQKLIAANAQTFLPGSTHDELWMSV